MGAKRSHRIPRRTALVPAALVPALALAVAGLTACDPVGGLNSAAVALTTEQAATTELEHHHVDIKWLTCHADLNRGASATPSAAATTKDVADVDCQGETKDGRAITVKGKVTQEVEGRCVKGDLTAKVAGKTVFRSSVLGDCDAPAPTTPGRTTSHPGGGPTAAVTVTVTATVTVTESFRGK
ncbi:hypothetical protein [Streptomyces sp. NBC_00083]|uniref:hypothetical protein n=1 Tax=Streptomyces sp. NBC_00083 TaxID=2975647 RepID=UPI00225A22B9|nr:hypothetical protein [Streptomyces sp. NBC_00083]MCX5382554.1 hypothetical protein [Streptomyces sp. NBC_00083]